MRVDLLYSVHNENHASHFWLEPRHYDLPEIAEERFQQLNRNLASHADIHEEILEDVSTRGESPTIWQMLLLSFCPKRVRVVIPQS